MAKIRLTVGTPYVNSDYSKEIHVEDDEWNGFDDCEKEEFLLEVVLETIHWNYKEL